MKDYITKAKSSKCKAEPLPVVVKKCADPAPQNKTDSSLTKKLITHLEKDLEPHVLEHAKTIESVLHSNDYFHDYMKVPANKTKCEEKKPVNKCEETGIKGHKCEEKKEEKKESCEELPKPVMVQEIPIQPAHYTKPHSEVAPVVAPCAAPVLPDLSVQSEESS